MLVDYNIPQELYHPVRKVSLKLLRLSEKTCSINSLAVKIFS